MFVHQFTDRNKIKPATLSAVPAVTGLVVMVIFFVAFFAGLVLAALWLVINFSQAANLNLWIAAGIMLACVFCLIALWLGIERAWAAWNTVRRLNREGKVTKGEIFELWTEINIEDHTSRVFMAAIRFSAPDASALLTGRPGVYEFKESLSEKVFINTSIKSGMLVRYLSEDPSICRLENNH